MPEVFRDEGMFFSFMQMKVVSQCIFTLEKLGGYAKFWLMPIELDSSKGLKSSDLMKAENMIINNEEKNKEKWYSVFGY